MVAWCFGIFLIAALLFRLLCGIFIIQPLGAFPEGMSIVYWKYDLNLNVPFIASADGILDKDGKGVSILGRVAILGALAKPIKDREIFRFGYSENLYLWSTGGSKYER